MTRDEAREYFKIRCLAYKDICPIDITQLAHLIDMELLEYLHTGGDHAQGMGMKIAPIRKKDIVFGSKGFVGARIQVDGRYFKRREAVTLSETGFIGFGGELDEQNVQPILKGFCKWCDDMEEQRSEGDEMQKRR